MTRKKCNFCGGMIKAKRKPFVIETNGQQLLIEDLPCFECARCGLTNISFQVMDTTKKIGRIFRKGELNTQTKVIPTIKYDSCLSI